MRVQVLCSVGVKVKEVQAAMRAAQQSTLSSKCPYHVEVDAEAHLGHDVPSHVLELQMTCDGARCLTPSQHHAEGQAPFSIASVWLGCMVPSSVQKPEAMRAPVCLQQGSRVGAGHLA